METITLFLESAKESSVDNFSQDQTHKHKSRSHMSSQLPFLECQRYMKMLRPQLQPILAVAIRISETLLCHAEKLSSNMETLLCFTCLFLTSAKLGVLFFPR